MDPVTDTFRARWAKGLDTLISQTWEFDLGFVMKKHHIY